MNDERRTVGIDEPAEQEQASIVGAVEEPEPLVSDGVAPILPGTRPPEPEREPEPEPEQHAAGGLRVPGGYTVIEGTASGAGRTVGIVVARFNGEITNRLLESALNALAEQGVAPEAVAVMPVPGAFELPLAAMAMAKTRRYSCVVALGAVVRGETPHFDYVAGETASGLQLAALETGVPVAFGVLTTDTVAQAEARIDKGAEAVRTALEMADVFTRVRAAVNAAKT
jgi:6,7-dimethyl-8-ribityllumazine synthase